jgi:hypothetical protein
MDDVIKNMESRFPKLRFVPGKHFCWSPESGEIIYKKLARGQTAIWSILHETGHALLNHTTYEMDFELLHLEMAAWEKARLLASDLIITIDEDHIQDCLDTYRDWLFKRSICPNCTAKCLQQRDIVHYRCFNCHKIWRVSSNRFGRAYRRSKNIQQTVVFE